MNEIDITFDDSDYNEAIGECIPCASEGLNCTLHGNTLYTLNLHENYFVHRDGVFDEKVEIVGRGKFK